MINKNAEKFRVLSFKNQKGSVLVFPEICKGCGLCIEVCPQKVIKYHENKLSFLNTPTVQVDIKGCIFCFLCEQNCPDCAIAVEKSA